MSVQKLNIVDIDLNSGNIHRSWNRHSIGTADNQANAFGVRVFRDGEPESLSGVSVQGYFRDPRGNNIAITSGNTVDGNTAYVVLPQACYNYQGQFCLAIKLIGGGITGTVRIVDGMVDNTHTGGAVAPTETVPTYQEILALYEDMLDDVEDYENVVATQNGQISGLESAVTQLSSVDGIGIVGSGTASNGNLTISGSNGQITINGSHSASTFFEIDGAITKISGMTSALNTFKAKANHTYKFAVEKISGSYTGTVNIVIGDGASTSLYDLTGNGGSVEFSFNADKNISIIAYIRYSSVASSLVARVSLIDITKDTEFKNLNDDFESLAASVGNAIIGTGSATKGSLTITVNKNTATLNGSDGTSSFFEIDNGVTSIDAMTSALNKTKLKANHIYKFMVEKISGSYSGTVNFVIGDGGANSLYDLPANGGSVEFSFQTDKDISIISYVAYNASTSNLVARVSLLEFTETADLNDLRNDFESLADSVGDAIIGTGSAQNGSLTISATGNRVQINGSNGASSYFEIDRGITKITNAASAICRTKAKANHVYRLSSTKISGSFVGSDDCVLFIIGDGGSEWLYQVSANGGNVDFSFNTSKDISIICYVKWATEVTNLISEVTLVDVTNSGNKYSIFDKYNEQIANAVCGADYYRGGGMITGAKNFSLMMVTDSHFDYESVLNAIELAEGMDSVDGLIHLGDTSSLNSIPLSGVNPFVANVINKATITKPFFVALGNHDGQQNNDSTLYGTVEQGVSAIMPHLNTASAYSERGYGHYDFDTYKIRLIILNCFDFPESITNNEYDYSGAKILWQQDQIDYLVDTLKTVPTGYTVVLASHYPEVSNIDNSKIDQHPGMAGSINIDNAQIGVDTFMSDVVVSDIINAYKGRTTINKTYTYSNGTKTGTVSINDSFASAYGELAIWICGHRHKSCFAETSVGDCWVYVNDTSGCGTKESSWVTAYSNQPRAEGTNTRDLITVMSIDTGNKLIKFTRIGAHISRFLDDENMILLSYGVE